MSAIFAGSLNRQINRKIAATKSFQAPFVAWYNLCRKHEALKGETPAMASGLSDHVWAIKELIEKSAEA